MLIIPMLSGTSASFFLILGTKKTRRQFSHYSCHTRLTFSLVKSPKPLYSRCFPSFPWFSPLVSCRMSLCVSYSVKLHQVLFYGILINTVFFFLLPESRNTSGWIQALFPVTRKEYWYFTAYAGVFFLSPFINQMFRNLSEKQIKTLFCFTLVVFSVVPTISQTFTPQQDVFYMGDGYSVFWLTLMYLLGACIKKLNLVSHSKKKKYFILYFFCILITWSSKILVEKFPISGFTLDSSFLIHYTSPFIVLAAMSLLLIFGSMNFSEFVKKMIMLISPLSFGVYLLHDHPLVRSYVMTDRFAFITNGSVTKMLLLFFGAIFSVFAIGCCVDAVRSKLFQLLHIRKSLSKLDRYFDV